MKEEKKGKGRKNFPWPTVVLILAIAFGIFLRFYHFSDWLHFELDQGRDAKLVDDAFFNDPGGPGELPLLGMRAAGTSLRLGPGFYYLQYLSALVFGMTPSGVASFIPILSVLSVAAFFLYAKRFFSPWLSAGLAFLFSVSTFLVFYGRFAWNPNPLPFFSLVGFYSLLRSVDPAERYRGRFLAVSAFFLAFATHLHFLAFVSYPVVVFLFLVIRRPRFSIRAWMATIAVVLLLYAPVLFNEFETGFANSKAFVESATETSTESEHSVAAKFIRNVTEHATGYLLLSTGYEGGGFFTLRRTETGLRAHCDPRCMAGWKPVAVALTVFSLSFLSAVFLWWKERGRRESDMILLSGVWFSATFLVLLPVSYDMVPRFFLLAAPVPFLLLGFLSEAAYRIVPWKGIVIVGIVAGIAVSVGSNLWFTADRFTQLARAPHEAIETPPDRILKEKTRFPLGQMMMIVSLLRERQEATGGWTVFMHSEPEYRRALKYLFELEGMENEHLTVEDVYEEGIYVLILRSGSNLDADVEKYLPNFDPVAAHPFGTMTMIEFRPKPEAIIGIHKKIDSSPEPSTRLPRYTWREWWQRNNDPSNDDDEGED